MRGKLRLPGEPCVLEKRGEIRLRRGKKKEGVGAEKGRQY